MSRERPTSAFIGPCVGPSSFAQRGSWWCYIRNDHLGLLARQSIEAQHGYVRLVEPAREKFWPKADQDENPSRFD